MELQEVLKLLELMEAHGLDEIEVEQEGTRIRLRKTGHPPVVAPIIAAPVAAAMPQASAPAAPTPAEQAAAKDADLIKIISPMVGTFYRSPSPDADAFANVGDSVHAEKVVCIIEAMKVMNEIKAEVEGEIVQVLVENGESVEYGQPLMTVRRAQSAK